MLILIAEDDTNLRHGLAELLKLEGFETVTAKSGTSAVATFKSAKPDFCILDVNMPGLDGFEACKQIRRHNPHVPVLFLTARNEEIDRILGFGLGADDYMGKPFSAQELVARIKAISRRTSAPSVEDANDDAANNAAGNQGENEGGDIFKMCGLKVDPQALRGHRGKTAIELSPRDVAVLKLLHQRAGFVVSRDELYNHCWGQEHYSNSRALDQFISTLRRKIENDPAAPRIIATVHGAGYRFDP